jgi:hypothetical protein
MRIQRRLDDASLAGPIEQVGASQIRSYTYSRSDRRLQYVSRRSRYQLLTVHAESHERLVAESFRHVHLR